MDGNIIINHVYIILIIWTYDNCSTRDTQVFQRFPCIEKENGSKLVEGVVANYISWFFADIFRIICAGKYGIFMLDFW